MVMAEQQGVGGIGNSLAMMMRDYRKGNWTLTETMVLIEAKKTDDERRMRIRTSAAIAGVGESSTSSPNINKPSEPRWKWVEDYCWRKGCFRSQNQCNDKWDNLMRDYKKVRDYERRRRSGTDTTAAAAQDFSYWKMDKAERKDRNLPTNLLPQIYEALVEVVERKLGLGGGINVVGGGPSGGGIALHPAPSAMLPPLPLPLQYVSAPLLQPLPQQPSPATEPPPRPPPFSSPIERSETSDSETNEQSHSSPAKRRRRIAAGGEEEGKRPSAAAAASSDGAASYEAVGTAISRSASVIAEALQVCDEREERRHRDLLGVQERRLKLEESNAETNRKGIDSLVEAINKLADSIQALAASSSSKSQSSLHK